MMNPKEAGAIRKPTKRQATKYEASARGKSEAIWFVRSKNAANTNGGCAITALEYATFQEAFNYFNERLFAGALPQLLITLQRKARAKGSFASKKYQHRSDSTQRVHEIALNPDSFVGRSDKDIASTLVHEMVHVWQEEFGDHSSRSGYHNREWGAKMRSIGLMPSSTGEPGGAMTGDHMSHYILEGGPFDLACRAFLKDHKLVWETATEIDAGAETPGGSGVLKKHPRAKVKFTCPICGANVWGAPSAQPICGPCSKETGELIPMLNAEGMSPAYGAGSNPTTVTDYERVMRFLREAMQKANWSGVSQDERLHAVMDFVASDALKIGGEDALRAVIERLGKRVDDWRAGTFPER